jgi:subtilisin family serine protease
MTVGFDLNKLFGATGSYALGEEQNSVFSDDSVKNFLNKTLVSAGVSENLLNVKAVSSTMSGDSVRFLQLDGVFSSGFGVATSYFTKSLNKQSALNGAITFLRESVNVKQLSYFDETSGEQFKTVSSFKFSPIFAPFFAATNSSQPSKYQWAEKQFDYAKAQELLAGGKKQVTVAVIDTGVDLEHPDLKDVLVSGKSFVEGVESPQDGNGHGTHCAGTIASQGASGPDAPLGIAAKANVKIMPIKVLSDEGSGSSQAIEKGIRYAMQQNVDVISMSLGGGMDFSDAKSSGGLNNPVLNEAIEKGIIVIVAAGNESCPLGGECKNSGGLFSGKINEYTVVPCAYEGTICVGSTDSQDKLSSFSNYSSKKSASYRTKADVNAPGTKIFSTWPTDKGGPYKAISGTSMATPYVAGIAALLKSHETSTFKVTQDVVRKYLTEAMAKPTDVVQQSDVGRVDLFNTAALFAKEKLGKSNATPVPVTEKPVSEPEIPEGYDGTKGGSSAVPSLFSLLCAVSG